MCLWDVFTDVSITFQETDSQGREGRGEDVEEKAVLVGQAQNSCYEA